MILASESGTVGHSLKSETSEIYVVRFFDPNSNCNIVIIDTPGFDNSCSEVTDTDILKKITAFIPSACLV